MFQWKPCRVLRQIDLNPHVSIETNDSSTIYKKGRKFLFDIFLVHSNADKIRPLELILYSYRLMFVLTLVDVVRTNLLINTCSAQILD